MLGLAFLNAQLPAVLQMVVIAALPFPEWGAELTTLFVAMVAIHKLVGPVLLYRGLRRAGEVEAEAPTRRGPHSRPPRLRATVGDVAARATTGSS